MRPSMGMLGVLGLGLLISVGHCQEDPVPPPDAGLQQAITAASQEYLDAFNRHDAAAVASLWTVTAEYRNPITEVTVVGRKAMEQQLQELFAEQPEIRLEMEANPVQSISPHVAIETGTAVVLTPNASPDVTQFTTVFVFSNGDWLIDRMTETPFNPPPSQYEHLKVLEWMVGEWVDEEGGTVLTTRCWWAKNQNFLVRSFKLEVAGQIDMSGMQMIGWDPAQQKIRSWVFDSDGGFGSGTWTPQDGRWVVSTTGTLPDGRRATAVNIIAQIDENTMTWESTGRELDGEILPNIEKITIQKASRVEERP